MRPAGTRATDTRTQRQALRRKPVPCAALQAERRGVPQPRSDTSKATVVAAMAELVEAGLASWRERAGGRLELYATGGGRWLLMADGVRRLA